MIDKQPTWHESAANPDSRMQPDPIQMLTALAVIGSILPKEAAQARCHVMQAVELECVRLRVSFSEVLEAVETAADYLGVPLK
jgi:hypothetical protein